MPYRFKALHYEKMTKEVQLKNRFIVIRCLVIVSITFIYLYFAVTSPEGRNCLSSSFIDLSEEPVQKVNRDAYIPNIVLGSREYTIIPLAEYRIAGMVVSKKRYHRGFMSDLSPYDFALIWGKTSEYLPYLKFDQIVRFCLYKYKTGAPIDIQYLNEHFSNNHLIPANKNIKQAMGKVKKKEIVQLEGYLVNVLGRDKKKRFSSWNTSTTRTDEGNGACEIIYVTFLRINHKEYF